MQRTAQLVASGSRAAVVTSLRDRARLTRQHAPKEHTPPERRARLLQLLRDHSGNTAETQARRMLLALEGGPATTIELRRYLDVMQVSTRIYELRSDGHHIDTVWVQQETDSGKPHRVALYVLRARAR
ncbi:helix-turn-helix domain-containing protein [Hydrogenophaga aquatica]